MIDPGDLLDANEVADLLGLAQRQAVAVYRARYPDFPAPVVAKARCMLWARADVIAWRDARRRP